MKLLDIIAGYKCPGCGARLPRSEINRTDRWRRKWRPTLDHCTCDACGAKVRISDSFLVVTLKGLFVVFPVFLLSCSLGLWVFGEIPLTRSYNEFRGTFEANGLGFVLMVILIVFPAMLATSRIWKITLVDPEETGPSSPRDAKPRSDSRLTKR